MTFERKLIHTKLVGFLTGEISKAEIYEWALFVVVSSDYDELIKDNKLTEEILKFLIDIDKARLPYAAPTKKILEYLIQCLEGKIEFSQSDYKALLGDKPPQPEASPVVKPVVKEKPPVSLGWLITAARIYAVIFLIGLILMNSVSVIKPNLLVKANEIAPSATETGKQALPHLVYGVLMLLAMSMKVPRFVFYGFIPLGIWGMFFYWSAATSFALKSGLSVFNIALLLMFVALPPTAAFFVLLIQWFSSPGDNKEEINKQGEL